MINTVNTSTKFSGLQLHLGRSPRVIPPIVVDNAPVQSSEPTEIARQTIQRLMDDVAKRAIICY
jgi:hypothetical protein